jgi:predicted enzyme involved in methoxymalonyl-ACP biosynthesis
LLRSYTVEPIEPVLKLRLLLEGFRPTFWTGGYNQYVQEIVDGGSALHEFRPDIVLLMIRIEEVMPDLVDEFPSRAPFEWAGRIASRVADLAGLLDQIERTLGAQVIVQNMTPPPGTHFGVYDAQHPGGQGYVVHDFNRALAAQMAGRQSAFLWDFDALVRHHGHQQLDDAKMWYSSRNPYKQSAYPLLAADLMRYLMSALGRVRKCVVLDLDNTLWGGVAGEDGIDGIQLGHTYPGNCYRDFQKELLKLHDRTRLPIFATSPAS